MIVKNVTNKYSIWMLALLTIGCTFLGSCTKDTCTETTTYTRMDPVYMNFDEFRSSVAFEAAKTLENTGKIYLYGNYFFVNELKKGVHVFDVSDLSNPQNIGFIKILGNVDIAIRDNILLADSFMDIVAIDISDPQNPQELKRLEDVYETNWGNGIVSNEVEGIVVDWTEEEVTEESDCTAGRNGGVFWNNVDFLSAESSFGGGFDQASSAPTGTTNAPPGTGTAGSFARFAIVDDYLYAIDFWKMYLFDIATPSNPIDMNATADIGWDIETLFPHNNHLFIGSQSGMFIYSLENPASPSFVSEFQHANSCDPVVVEGDYAYVTLRNGNECGGFTNQMEIIDISNLSNPVLNNTIEMFNPHGLGIDDGTLFLCDGAEGLKIFDVNLPDNSNGDVTVDLLKTHSNINAYDVIPLDDILFMVASEGFYIYDYQDTDNISLLSSIQVQNQ